MTEKDKEKFVKILIAVAEIYRIKLSKPMIELYFTTLKEYPIEKIQQAFEFHIKNTENGEFFPKPADIIKQIIGDEKERGLVAWEKLMRAIRKYGYYHSVIFDDPVIAMVVNQLGGWLKVSEVKVSEIDKLKREFLQWYSFFEKHPRKVNQKLVGYIESENLSKGFKDFLPEPFLITEIEEKRLKEAEVKMLIGGERNDK